MIEFTIPQKPTFTCACCDQPKFTRSKAKQIPWITSRGDTYFVCQPCIELMDAAGYKTIYHYLKDEGKLP